MAIELGTNDLIQYLFAVNRDQYDLKRHNRFSHPAFLRLLSHIVLACERHGKQLIACGEMASHPLGSSLLLALGVKCLSVFRASPVFGFSARRFAWDRGCC
jgi:phosphoenolpyruvate-protein kinase (PTS system EI component)